MKDFQDKIAVITGGASGIGYAVAKRLADEGMKIVLADFEEEALENAVTTLRQQEHEVLGVLANVLNDSDIDNLYSETIREFGKVHILFNNAGVADAARIPIWESSMDDWNWVFGINFDGVLRGLRKFMPTMIDQGEPAHVINTASVAGLIHGNGIYGISKHAVVALSESIYQSLQTIDSQVNASVLCPPLVKTKIFESARNRPGVEEFESLRRADMLEDAMTAEEIAEFVFNGIMDERFYLIPESSFDADIESRGSNINERRNFEARIMRTSTNN